MTTHRLTGAAPLLLALALIATSTPARAGDPAQDAASIRDRIAQGVAAGLAKPPADVTPAPLVSHPATLATPRHAHAATAAPAHEEAAGADSTADAVWGSLLAGNRRFVGDHPLARQFDRERAALVSGQHPRAIVLGCADSRVSPEIVFDQTLGQLFVVRTAGNIVDPIALGSIEYAVEHLHPKLLVVLGHGGCGAVKAAVAGGTMPTTHLQAIVDRIHPTVERLSPCFEGDELVQRCVIANARQSATDVVGNSEVLRDAVAKGELKVVSAVYDLASGLVTPVSAPAATAAASAAAH